ncbi:uncharacterized protein MONOS_12043 [Monocercomonoides exilis]|uniref:uncharacterized protein n=1 Tax=Monocercomonoides exilis TaxID=2049356 RepID=UPI00355A7BD7|nr:hypothetical protein MONOS_12043 [Monocercomonoides exilis]|eukprot:MONOS_12043.1-p1 / transcript=MONOS_12043.1 / gene=MONOS_12043 / organism=Monocercomonoides_exilis_PA203 / gene_product=unspecified product / transcript_product=unspecified product / location=Mono_scaffold00639:11154-13308(-) / protein_length=560 / sequence_SO=supercontig / SO=protein_coding / is_pseudo=false
MQFLFAVFASVFELYVFCVLIDYGKKLTPTALPSQIKRAGSPFGGRSTQLRSTPFQPSSTTKRASGDADGQTKLLDLSLAPIQREDAIDSSVCFGNPPSQIDDSDYFMSRARLLASRKISFGAMERRGSYFMPMEGNMWRESRGPLLTCTREGVRRLGERFEEMMEAKETNRPGVEELIIHNQMCIDVTLGDVEEMLGNAAQRGRRAAAPDTNGACVCVWRAVEGARGGGMAGKAAAGIAEEQGGRPGEDEGECSPDAERDVHEVRGAGGGAGGGEGEAGAVDLGAEGAARGGEAGDGEAVFGVQHTAAEVPRRRADLKADERVEEDPGAEREEQCRGEGAAGAAGGDEGEGRIYCGGIEKEKKRRTQQGGVVSEDSEGAGAEAGTGLAADGACAKEAGAEEERGSAALDGERGGAVPEGLCGGVAIREVCAGRVHGRRAIVLPVLYHCVKIKLFFEKFEGPQSEKGEAKTSAFLAFLMNHYWAEIAKRKEAMKTLNDVICSGDPSAPSTSSSASSSKISSSSPGAVCRGITYSELESLLCVCHSQTPSVLLLRIFRDA